MNKRSEMTPLSQEHSYSERVSLYSGIEAEYQDNWGRVHAIPIDIKKKLLKSMGIDASSEKAAENSYMDALERNYSQLSDPCVVTCIDQLPATMSFRMKRKTDQPVFRKLAVNLSVVPEIGLAQDFIYIDEQIRYDGVHEGKHGFYHRWSIPFPDLKNLGYFTLHLTVTLDDVQEKQTINVAVCPQKAFIPKELDEGGRAAGIFFSLYGVRSLKNWGIGDFGDLKKLIQWVSKELKGSLIGINPLHATFNRSPFNTSPYLPITKLYRNFIYLDIPAMEDYPRSAAQRFGESEATKIELERLRASERVCYEEVAALKTKALKLVFENFLEKHWQQNGGKTSHAKNLEKFIAKEGAPLNNFATFCALDSVIRKENPQIWIWPQWPEEYKRANSDAVKRFQSENWFEILFQIYLQWQIEVQLRDAQEYAKQAGMAIGLYHDLALAVDQFGSDTWAYPDHFIPDTSVGAPPDAFSQNGQDWGFPPPNANVHKNEGYKLFIQEIRKNCMYGGALRIDHVMRFFHLYLIPRGCSPAHGAYVAQSWEDLVRLLMLESVRNSTMIIGEDLGTVPGYIRERLEAAGILSYRLLFFEKDHSGHFIKPEQYPQSSLVAITTHDLPTLRGFWSCRDIDIRKHGGLFHDHSHLEEAIMERKKDKEQLIKLVVASGLLDASQEKYYGQANELTDELQQSIIGLVAITRSKLFILNQEDLFKESDQQNLPGTTHQYPNWSIKMRFNIEELRTRPEAINCAAMFRRWVEASGRVIESKEEKK